MRIATHLEEAPLRFGNDTIDLSLVTPIKKECESFQKYRPSDAENPWAHESVIARGTLALSWIVVAILSAGVPVIENPVFGKGPNPRGVPMKIAVSTKRRQDGIDTGGFCSFRIPGNCFGVGRRRGSCGRQNSAWPLCESGASAPGYMKNHRRLRVQAPDSLGNESHAAARCKKYLVFGKSLGAWWQSGHLAGSSHGSGWSVSQGRDSRIQDGCGARPAEELRYLDTSTGTATAAGAEVHTMYVVLSLHGL